jgi:hypothetical protein
MNRRLFVSIFFCAFFCLSRTAGSASARTGTPADIVVVSSDDSGCMISFTPRALLADTVHLNGKTYGFLSFDRSVPYGQPGDPLIPCRIFSVGVPPEGAVRVSLVDADAGETRNMRLIPVPGVEKKDGLGASLYREGSVYQSPGAVPRSFFHAE